MALGPVGLHLLRPESYGVRSNKYLLFYKFDLNYTIICISQTEKFFSIQFTKDSINSYTKSMKNRTKNRSNTSFPIQIGDHNYNKVNWDLSTKCSSSSCELESTETLNTDVSSSCNNKKVRKMQPSCSCKLLFIEKGQYCDSFALASEKFTERKSQVALGTQQHK